MALIRSKDRKVTNAVSPNGKTPTIANTFGLPAGKDYSCPNQTPTCAKVCYAGKLEKIYKGVRNVLLTNWDQLSNATMDEMIVLLDDMINEFKTDCEKRSADKLFRIHWDGDFFSDEYAYAWKVVIENNADVKFWVYTRVPTAAIILNNIPNLSLYFSTDNDNKDHAKNMSVLGIKLAYLADTFSLGKEQLLNLVSKTGVPCPENSKKIKLIDNNGSACVKCGQCVFNRNNILFSATKK